MKAKRKANWLFLGALLSWMFSLWYFFQDGAAPTSEPIGIMLAFVTGGLLGGAVVLALSGRA